MNENQTDILTDTILDPNTKKRKHLLPWWIKIFMWLFLILGLLSPLALVYGILGSPFQVSLYGLQTYEPASLTGLIVISLFLLKGIVAYGLLTEKDWAITLSIVDAGIGIFICVVLMLYPFFLYGSESFVFRLELILLIPYLIKMVNIRSEWKSIKPINET